MRSMILAVIMTVGMAPSLAAENIALVISNQSYATLTEARGAGGVEGAVEALEEMGFAVITGTGLSALEMREHLAALQAQIENDGAERVVVVLAGHFAHAQSGAWLMGTQAERLGLAQADGEGLRLEPVLEIAAEARNSALIWLAETGVNESFGVLLQAGLPARLAVPQGVGVVRGRPDAIMAGLRAVLRPGTALAPIVERSRNLSAEGTVPALVPFLPAGFAPGMRADLRAFATAQDADTEAAYLAYLEAFPNGQNAQSARAALERLRNAPERVEERLLLTRDERRAIQRDLTVLGHDTRGIDGIFGPATRRAITLWQGQSGMEGTGYLTRDQIFNLATEAARRSVQIEAEERAQREALERADREFWAMTGAEGDAPGLRSYLERYPNGIFASLARDRLNTLAEIGRAEDRARDLEAWRRARAADTESAYQTYLRDWPEGEFAPAARATLDARAPALAPEPEDNEALAAERALGLGQPTRLLIEQRLARLGYDPGPLDGVFDDQSRRAIMQAQQEFDLPVTGFMSQDLLTALLSTLLREFFD
jgi:peptidoglycan hydrolase-like protein with peptidoglycan-binding domain